MKKLVITILVVAIVLFGTSFALRSTAEEKAQAEHLWLLQTLLPDSTDFVLEPYTGAVPPRLRLNSRFCFFPSGFSTAARHSSNRLAIAYFSLARASRIISSSLTGRPVMAPLQ